MGKTLATIGGLIATTALSVFTIQQLSSSEIVPILIFEDSNQTEYKGKFGEDFSYHFVSTQDSKNKDWWETVAKSRWDRNKEINGGFHSEFTNIDSANSLKEKCNDAYKKTTKNDIHPTQNGSTDKVNYERDIWKYCSRKGELPITLEKSSNSEDKSLVNSQTTSIGQVGKGYLISTRDSRNDWFWKDQEKALNKKTQGTEEHNDLKKFLASTGNDAKEKCESLYKISGSGENDSEKTTWASKFCSLLATEVQENST